MTGQSLKEAIAFTLVAALLVTVAATALLLAAPDAAQAASDTSQKVGDEVRGWLTVLFLVVAGFAALPVIGRLDVGRGFGARRARADPRRLRVRSRRRPHRHPQHLVGDRLMRSQTTTRIRAGTAPARAVPSTCAA